MRTLEETIRALETEIEDLGAQMRVKHAALEMAKNAPSEEAFVELVRQVLNGHGPGQLSAALLAEAAPSPLPPAPIPVPASLREAVAAAAAQAIAREEDSGTLDAPIPPPEAVATRRDVEADEAVLLLLADGPKRVPELAKRLKRRGEEPAKVVDRLRVRLARLVEEGRVVRVARGLYGRPTPSPTRPGLTYPETACEVVWNGSMKRPLCASAGGLGSALGGLTP